MKDNYDIYKAENGTIIKAWTQGVFLEQQAIQQLKNTANMPFIYKHLAVMPDAHLGMGATIGSVVATRGAVIPSAVGVDIGCGMQAVKTSLTAKDLPDSLLALRMGIENIIPVGFNQYKQNEYHTSATFDIRMVNDMKELTATHPTINKMCKNPVEKSILQSGTLGGGNHFIELCLDENQDVWIMLHSGSRGIGNIIGRYFIELAKRDMERYHIHLADKDLSYLSEGTTHFDEYIKWVEWAQEYARINREVMMARIVKLMTSEFKDFELLEQAINCHHNYISKENHFGANVIVTRKGAVRARDGDLGIIPGSMGAKSFIVRGKGNRDSFHSCSHGAGRMMSRTEAKKTFTVADQIKATEGVECKKDESVIDEIPMAYKNIDEVMKAQDDLVEIVYTLKQVLCVKG